MRRVVALMGLLLLLFGLTACGDDGSASDSTGSGLDAITVTGDFGKAPEVKWNSQVETDKLESKTLIEGDGDKVVDGDQVLMNIWIGNGYAQEEAYSTWSNGQAAPVKVDDSQVNKAIYTALVDHTVGSRVEVVSPPDDAFGDQGNTSLGIAPTDNVVFVVDIMDKVRTEPSGTSKQAPADAPKLQLKDGVPTGFDFSKAPKTPPTSLQVHTLIEGDGPKVAKGDNVIVNYLGVVYGDAKPFDESYSGEPFSTTVGTGAVIKGWDQALVGVPVGSRLMLVIPPDLAYGEKGQGSIKGNSTLVFVVDVLAAY